MVENALILDIDIIEYEHQQELKKLAEEKDAQINKSAKEKAPTGSLPHML